MTTTTTTPPTPKRGRPQAYSAEPSPWARFHGKYRGFSFRNVATGAIVTKLSMYYKLKAAGKLEYAIQSPDDYVPEHYELIDVPGWRNGRLISENKANIQ